MVLLGELPNKRCAFDLNPGLIPSVLAHDLDKRPVHGILDSPEQIGLRMFPVHLLDHAEDVSLQIGRNLLSCQPAIFLFHCVADQFTGNERFAAVQTFDDLRPQLSEQFRRQRRLLGLRVGTVAFSGHSPSPPLL